MVRRIGSLAALLLVAALVLAACGSEDEDVEPTVTRIPVDNAPPTMSVAGGAATSGSPVAGGEATTEGGGQPSEAVTIDVEMLDVRFGVTEIRVPTNSEVTINLVNNGVAAHNFNIDELGVQSGDYQAGQTGSVTFNSGAAGEYAFYCSIPGHRDAGMEGTLIVSDEAAPPADGEASPAARPAVSPVAEESPGASPESGASPAASPIASPVSAVEPPAAGATTFDIELVDINFDPKELKVPANTEITINAINNGVAVHTFTIADLGVDTGNVLPGQTATVTFNSGTEGTHAFVCTIPGHEGAGMVGTLVVTGESKPDAGVDENVAASPVASPLASPAVAEASPVSASDTTTFDIELVDINFDPKELRVPANTEITINAINSGVAAHTFTIADLSVDTGQLLSGETVTVTFNSGPAGTHTYVCTIPGHEGAGMTGTLVVE